MKRKTSLTLEYDNIVEFRNIHGDRKLSEFVDRAITDEINRAKMRYWVICTCGFKTIMTVLLRNGGNCKNCKRHVLADTYD